MRLILVLLLSAMLAGCADEAAPTEQADNGFDDKDVTVTDDTGAVRGVVVDQAILPLEDVTVLLPIPGDERTTTTDDQGRFTFSEVPPGTYFMTFTKPIYVDQGAGVTVEAGVEQPDVVRVQMDRMFDQDPFKETVEYKGFIGCAYNFGISSTCVNDYTRICGNVDPSCCPGGCAPQVTGVVDQREYRSSVDAGWQSIVWEVNWDSSLSGTSAELGLTVSFAERTGASHWYTSTSQSKPFRLQCDLATICPEQNDGVDGEPMIAPEGQDNLWNMLSAGDDDVAVQQDIEIFQTNFYYAVAPSDWSFIDGSPDPF